MKGFVSIGIPVTAPLPLIYPKIVELTVQLGLASILQSSVIFILKVSSPKTVVGVAGTGKVPIFHTIDPLPKGSKLRVLGVGAGAKKIVLTALPGT